MASLITPEGVPVHNRDSKYKPELFKEGEMNIYCFVKQGDLKWHGRSDAKRGCGEQ